MQPTQKSKAELFRNLHFSGKLLILPNIWDALGARILEKSGYPSVATASVSTALTNGYTDGERIPYKKLLEVVKRISDAISIPLTVDIERGYAKTIFQLKENIRLLISHGGVGINIEDSLPDRKGFYSTTEQCSKIEAVKEMGIACGVPIVINARTDIFRHKTEINAMQQAVERAKAYRKAGADCIYPILIDNYEEISRFVQEVEMPVNVYLLEPISDMQLLEKIGVTRVSTGPQLLKHALTYMKLLVDDLKNYSSISFYNRELMASEYLNDLVE